MTITDDDPSTQQSTTTILSTQGEQQARQQRAATEFLTESEVDEYADTHSDEVNECRMTRNHPFPPPRRGVLASFVGKDAAGLYISHTDCPRCKCAYRVEKWEPPQGRRGRWHKVSRTVQYRTGPNGEKYNPPPGTGRIKPLMLQESVMNAAMQGVTKAEIDRMIKEADRNG